MAKLFSKFLLLLAVLILPLGMQTADARGGGRGGGRGAGRMGGSRGGGNKKKQAKADAERTRRENHDAFKREAAGDAQ
ncbi:MAG: hypothetical protein P1V36_07615 [Planctomycetota bacterium]|nr:hypothetical protein [Planctomycetota bacterium]